MNCDCAGLVFMYAAELTLSMAGLVTTRGGAWAGARACALSPYVIGLMVSAMMPCDLVTGIFFLRLAALLAIAHGERQ
jgi:hypothetical protein